MFLLVVIPWTMFAVAPGPVNAVNVACDVEKLVMYRVVVSTLWDRQTFPRQYPEWRPPAQWSKVLGYSHSSQFRLFRLGEGASDAMKEFAELGSTDQLDRINRTGVMDEFTASPVQGGVGSTQTTVFVDGNHTKVSLVSKIVPSPDWFIGVDSLDLCDGGRYVESLLMEAAPLDAGTDNGFTFTSPNWPTDPRGVVFTITNNYPPHPAGSFHYPDLAHLPPIVKIQLHKIREFSLSRTFQVRKAKTSVAVLDMKNVNRYKYDIVQNDDNSRNNANAMDNAIYAFAPKDTEEKRFIKKYKAMLTNRISDNNHFSKNNIPIFKSSINKKKKIRRSHHKSKKHRKPRNCKVSQWSKWGPCSRTCGIGESRRRRTIKKHPKNGGKPCPALKDMKWCGSARNCHGKYFKWGQQ